MQTSHVYVDKVLTPARRPNPMSLLNPNVLASLIDSAVSTQSTLLGRATHAQIIKTLHPPLSSFLSTHLINMYSKLDLSNSAQLVLSITSTRSVVTYTALISGYVQNGHFNSAMHHFSNMRGESIQPNDFTFPCLFKASASLQSPVLGKQLHSLALKVGLVNDMFVSCSAFDMYCKTGQKEEAGKLLDEMPHRNIATWNACISNSVLDGQPKMAIFAFMEFRFLGGEPNSITLCAFLNACSDCSYLQLGTQLHGFVVRSGFESDVSVANGLINFYE